VISSGFADTAISASKPLWRPENENKNQVFSLVEFRLKVYISYQQGHPRLCLHAYPGWLSFFSELWVKSYTKPPKYLDEQLNILISRGLVVNDREEAINWLSQVSYYRLRGYTYPLQNNTDPNHPFWKPTPIGLIKIFYEFDRELRLLVLDGLERVEIAMRTQIILNMSLAHGAWWFEDPTLFTKTALLERDIEELDKELKRSHEVFLQHYKSNYGDPPRPPAWMSLEVASFGLLSKFFQNLRIGLDAKKKIMAYFGLESGGARFLENWLQHLSAVRNICAHHSRLWNRIAKQPPLYAPGLTQPWVPGFPDPQRLYATLALLAWLTHKITGSYDWQTSLLVLFKKYPTINLKSMGFPQLWEEERFWKIKG
jgi:abortive infection bacteriophage resistance protein